MLSAVNYFVWFMAYSFIGWVYESVLCSVYERKLINRGFLNGPVCPVYGFGALTVILFLHGQAEHIFLIFFAGMLLTCTVEYITAVLLETLFQTKWWDYSKYRFQIHGRVCLQGAIVFGLFSVLLIEFIHPYVSAIIGKIPVLALIIMSAVMLGILICDLTITVNHILQMNERLKEIQQAINAFVLHPVKPVEDIKNVLHEKFENSKYFTERIRTLLHIKKLQDIRIMHAFPSLKSLKYNDALQKIKEKIIHNII